MAQLLEAPGQATGDRIRSDSDAACDQRHQQNDTDGGFRRRRPQAGKEHAPVGKVDAHGAPRSAKITLAAALERDRLAGGRDQLPIAGIERDVGVDILAQRLEHAVDLARRIIAHRKAEFGELAFQRPPLRPGPVSHHAPGHAEQQANEEQAREHGQIDLPEEAASQLHRCSILLVLAAREDIARATHRQDAPGMLRVILDGGADP